jgi:hypothetical protein
MAQVHIVMGGGIIIAVYEGDLWDVANRHARTISGTVVESYETRRDLPKEVREDLEWAAEWHDDEDENTPVIEISFEE